MSKVLAAHQPCYLPYVGTWWKYVQADTFVWLDSVQYTKGDWQNRNRVRNADGWQWLTVPVSASLGMQIRDVGVVAGWPRKHAMTLKQLYGKTPYTERLDGLLAQYAELDLQVVSRLVQVNAETASWVASSFDYRPEVVWASTHQLPDDPDDRLIALCALHGCDTYLSGANGMRYMNRQKWDAAGIDVRFARIDMPPYRQLFGGWVENLSIVDVVLSVGGVEEYVRSCGSTHGW